MSSYKPLVQGKTLVFHLHKPIYGSFYGIWDKWLLLAKKKRYSLKVVTPTGSGEFENYKEWLKEAKKMERFYLNPNKPMIFYGRYMNTNFQNE